MGKTIESRTEKQLDSALEAALRSNQSFLQWFLSRTKYAQRRAKYLWSRSDHPWGTIDFTQIDPDTGVEVVTRQECETDVLLVVKATDGEHLALHIENKLGLGSFTASQPEMYRQRAEQWKGRPKYQSYTDFVTVLVAPEAFRLRNQSQAAVFDVFISHEEIAEYIPLFRSLTNHGGTS